MVFHALSTCHVGRELIGTPVTLGIIPTGNGNGFARHFATPLSPPRAVAALALGETRAIGVGVVGEAPFLVTCSMAWEAAIADAFEKAPIRGILPYVFAGMQELFEYDPQDFKVTLDSHKTIELKKPLLFTIANLSQYGGRQKSRHRPVRMMDASSLSSHADKISQS